MYLSHVLFIIFKEGCCSCWTHVKNIPFSKWIFAPNYFVIVNFHFMPRGIWVRYHYAEWLTVCVICGNSVFHDFTLSLFGDVTIHLFVPRTSQCNTVNTCCYQKHWNVNKPIHYHTDSPIKADISANTLSRKVIMQLSNKHWVNIIIPIYPKLSSVRAGHFLHTKFYHGHSIAVSVSWWLSVSMC